MTLTVASWNVNSITARLPLVLKWLENTEGTQRNYLQPDIICFQEIKCIEQKFPESEFAALGYKTVSFGQPAYNGVAILVRDALSDGLTGIQKGFPGDAEDAQRRFLSIKLKDLEIINVYVPNGQAVGTDKYAFKLGWFEMLRHYLDQNCDNSQKVLICGDFNVAPDDRDVYDPTAWRGKVLFSEPEKKALAAIVEWGLEDAFRKLHPDETAYSWWDYRQASFRRNLGVRIDHFLLSANLMKKCLSVEIDREPRSWERPSDHTPVIVTFEI